MMSNFTSVQARDARGAVRGKAAKAGVAVGVSAGTGYAMFSSTPLLIAVAAVVGIVLVAVCIVVLTAARSDKKHRRDSAHGTLQTVLNFVLRLVGREVMPSSPPVEPTAGGRPATPVRRRPPQRRRAARPAARRWPRRAA